MAPGHTHVQLISGRRLDTSQRQGFLGELRRLSILAHLELGCRQVRDWSWVLGREGGGLFVAFDGYSERV